MGKDLRAVVFDLDDTLILTSSLEKWRKRREWATVYDNFSITSVPSETLTFLQSLEERFVLGVVTSAPRNYAEKLLQYHQCPISVLVAYHDTKNHKPHPEPFLKAATLLHLAPSQCIIVGDREEDMEAAESAGAYSIGISWSANTTISSRWPCFQNWNGLLEHINSVKEKGI